MVSPSHRYLFNFASSYSGGGKQILLSYLDFFNSVGGAYFVLNSRLEDELKGQFCNNKFFFVSPGALERLFNDGSYLNRILKKYYKFDFYFSYGIPIYKKIGNTNWLHISNLIPMAPQKDYLSFWAMIKMTLLRNRLKKYSENVDVLSADSSFALELSAGELNLKNIPGKVLKNGFSLNFVDKISNKKESVAITVGTQPYKDLRGLWAVYEDLKNRNIVERLIIIGDLDNVPKFLLGRPDVTLAGSMPHSDVLEHLARSKVYISTSLIENSSVASIEGAYLCGECFLSPIGPHREMLADLGLEEVIVEFADGRRLLHINGDIGIEHLKKFEWHELNQDFYEAIRSSL